MKRIPRQPEKFDSVALFDAIARRQGLAFTDQGSPDRFIEIVRNSLEAARQDLRFLQGGQVEAMFAAVVSSLGRAAVVKKEDAGDVICGETIRPPDYRIVLRDRTEFFVEVKNHYQKDQATSPMLLRVADVDQLRRYAEIFARELKIAIYWHRWALWTLTSLDQLPAISRGRYEITIQEALMNNEMFLLGDASVGTIPPLTLRLLTDPTKPRTIDAAGKCMCTIGGTEILGGNRQIRSPIERDLTLFLMFYGDWDCPDDTAPCRVERREIISWDLNVTPGETGEEDWGDFELMGSLSSMLSRKYNALTRSEGGIERQTAAVEPGSLGPTIPDKSEDLKLWRFAVRPKWWKGQDSSGDPIES